MCYNKDTKEREVNQMALIVNGIIYDILVLNVARSFGLESEEVLNFYNFVLNAKNDEEIQKEYNRIMGVN